MNISEFLNELTTMLKEKSNIDTSIAEDKNFPGGYYLSFTEFNTSVFRVNKDGKFSMRAVEQDGDKFKYPFSYKFLIPTDSMVEKLEKTFEKVHIDTEKEQATVLFPIFCYLNVLYQFYKRSLSSKRMWFDRYKKVEKKHFESIRCKCSNLPSRQALKLLPKEDQALMFE